MWIKNSLGWSNVSKNQAKRDRWKIYILNKVEVSRSVARPYNGTNCGCRFLCLSRCKCFSLLCNNLYSFVSILKVKSIFKIKSIFNISFGRFARNYVGTLAFHKIFTPWSLVELQYFTQWNLDTNKMKVFKYYNRRSVAGWTQSAVVLYWLKDQVNNKVFIENKVKGALSNNSLNGSMCQQNGTQES